MFITQHITLADTERALLFENKQFKRILTSGSYRQWGLLKDIEVDVYDITDSEGIDVDEQLKLLMNLYPERFEHHLENVVTTEGEIALIFHDEKLQAIVAESHHVAFWKDLHDLKVERLDVNAQPRLPDFITKAMQHNDNLMDLDYLTKDITLGANKKALLFKDEQLVEVLGSGHYRYWNQHNRFTAEIIDTNDALQAATDLRILALAEQHETLFAEHILRWETADNEVGLVYENNVLRDIQPPGQHGFYWLNQRAVSVQKMALEDASHTSIDATLAKQLRMPRETLLQTAVNRYVYGTEVSDKHVGFLMVDGKLENMLTAGSYAWWALNRKIVVKHIDLRLQNMEVNGQEILTKDHVSLRINLSATWQITDAQKVVQELADHEDYLYRELQLALRAVVSTKTLDELLADKNLLNQDVLTIVADKAASFGLDLKTTGVKDIILPGEMKEILAQVVEAQKIAEANLIRRREETHATRSLHNTAKVMEGNPTLLRLKEMEVLERVIGGVNTLNVYGGLDGVMNDMVKLTD